MKYDVFISYSRKDFKEVNKFVELLKKKIPTIKIWFDITGIESGDEFEDKIIRAINNSSVVLFALSANSMESKWTKDEVIYAKNINKKVVPILLKDAKLEEGWFLFKFGSIDCIDITDNIHIDKLVRDLIRWNGKSFRDEGVTYSQSKARSKKVTKQVNTHKKSDSLLSFEGRMNRLNFALTMLCCIFIGVFASLILWLKSSNIDRNVIQIGLRVFIICGNILNLWIMLAAQSKRAHDIGYDGIVEQVFRQINWKTPFNLLLLLFVLLPISADMFWIKGESGPNKYGPEP